MRSRATQSEKQEMDLQHGSKVHSEDGARDRAGDRHDCSVTQARSGCPGLGNLELLGHGQRVSVRVPGEASQCH